MSRVANIFLVKKSPSTDVFYAIPNSNNSVEISKKIEDKHELYDLETISFDDKLKFQCFIINEASLRNYKNQLDQLQIRHFTMSKEDYLEMLGDAITPEKKKTKLDAHNWADKIQLMVRIKTCNSGALISMNKNSELVRQIIYGHVDKDDRRWLFATFQYEVKNDKDVEAIKLALKKNEINFIIL